MAKGWFGHVDANGVRSFVEYELEPRGLHNCIDCVICGVLVNLHEYPNGRCWRCDFNKPWQAEKPPVDEQNIRASIPKGLRNGDR